MKRVSTLYFCALVACLLALSLSMSAQKAPAQPGVITESQFNRAVFFDVSPPLRDIAAQAAPSFGFQEASPALKPKMAQHLIEAARGITTTSQVTNNAPVQNLAPTPALLGVNILGVGKGFGTYSPSVAPPDVNLSVGDTQVVQWVNVSYAVFNKSTGAKILGPSLGQTLWTATPCSNHNSGDIVAQWDKLAHRWVMFQPVFTAVNGLYYGCFAISVTNDATGSYYRYAFPMTANFPDYPKLGIQQDAYYQSNNMFNAAGTAYLGAMPCAYNRVKMLAGNPTAEQVCTLDPSPDASGNPTYFDDSFVPADLDSPELPLPAGTPEVFLGSIDNNTSETNVYLYTYKANFTAGTAVLTGVTGSNPVSVASLGSYVGLCSWGSSGCIPQSGVTTSSSGLDSLGDRLMYRLALRRTVNAANVPVNHWVITHSIANGSTGAMRWYEFRSPNNNLTNLSLYQGGTYAPDTTTYRFMGAAAMDKAGNIAMAYSRSSSAIHPDMYYTGRLATDPLGTLAGELPIVNQTVATGSQRNTSHRWGDYTDMALDNDGCTFWYTAEYYTTTTTFSWATRVASIKFPSCTPWNPVP